jgi:hypothetical protein
VSPPDKPHSRQELAVVLAANAAAKPFNVVLSAGTIVAATVIGMQLQLALIVGLVVYALAATRTFLDADEVAVVLARLRGDRPQAPAIGGPRADAARLAPDVRSRLLGAHASQARIRDAIERAELPYGEVAREVDALVALMDRSAGRAQLLYEALDESPPSRIEQRLLELRGSGKAELVAALEHQLAVQRKVAWQLQRFYDEMERTVVELDTIRASLVSVSASTDAADQRRIAADVRSLRDELDALAAGMSEAFEETAPAGDTPPA